MEVEVEVAAEVAAARCERSSTETRGSCCSASVAASTVGQRAGEAARRMATGRTTCCFSLAASSGVAARTWSTIGAASSGGATGSSTPCTCQRSR